MFLIFCMYNKLHGDKPTQKTTSETKDLQQINYLIKTTHQNIKLFSIHSLTH